jgi:hypothetical protein
MWIVAVTAALLALASLLAMTSTTSASGDPGCPPPSAQLSAAQPGAPSEFKCAALDETYLTDPSPTTVSEPVDGDVVQTPTGTTTLPGTAP